MVFGDGLLKLLLQLLVAGILFKQLMPEIAIVSLILITGLPVIHTIVTVCGVCVGVLVLVLNLTLKLDITPEVTAN